MHGSGTDKCRERGRQYEIENYDVLAIILDVNWARLREGMVLQQVKGKHLII